MVRLTKKAVMLVVMLVFLVAVCVFRTGIFPGEQGAMAAAQREPKTPPLMEQRIQMDSDCLNA